MSTGIIHAVIGACQECVFADLVCHQGNASTLMIVLLSLDSLPRWLTHTRPAEPTMSQFIHSKSSSGGMSPDDTAKYDTLGEGRTPQATGSVDTATDLTGRKKSRNWASIQANDLGLGMDTYTAKSGMHLAP